MKNSKFLRSKNLMYGCKKGLRKETEEQTRHLIATPTMSARNDDTSVSEGSCLAEIVEESRSSKRTPVSCEESSRDVHRNAAFTLVELVIVIAIVIVLSVVSVPIYRNYVDKAKMTEGYATCATFLSAQKAYYSEHGNFYYPGTEIKTNFDSVLGIDIRGNKYFTYFWIGGDITSVKEEIWLAVPKPEELRETTKRSLYVVYNITQGARFGDNWNSI